MHAAANASATRNTTIAFVTLGCAKNTVDTDKMAARLIRSGYAIVDDPANAALVIVNTCSFLLSAVDEGIDTIFDILEILEEAGRGGKLLVAGCMPSRYGRELEDELQEVAGFVSACDEQSIVDYVAKIIGPPSCFPLNSPRLGERLDCGPSAFVKVSDGCDRFCSYCMIPYIRGRYRSFSLDSILSEVDELVSGGTREIVFIGQDTGMWGRDFENTSNITQLVYEASKRFTDTWFRILYLQPEGLCDELLELMANQGNVCAYLDMPLQHCNSQLLVRMNRSEDAESYLASIAHARRMVPNLMVRTTLMVGFPGESEAQFSELLDFVDEACFDYAVVFAYSAEEGSAAASFDNQVDEEVKIERARKLRDACEVIAYKRMKRHVGQRLRVLCESLERGEYGLEALCRWQGQAPEIDGQVHILINDDISRIAPGDFAEAKIINSYCYDLEGKLII